MKTTNYRFPAHQRLKKEKIITKLFNQGKHYKAGSVTVVWMFCEVLKNTNLQTGFSVSKRKFKKAVCRNRIKRQLREAWRYEKLTLENALTKNNKFVALMFIYTGENLPELTDIRNKILLISQHIQTQLGANFTV